jgi:urease accessory protein UreF
MISRTHQVSSERQSHPKSSPNNVSTCRELLEVLQETAESRKASAKVDERLAKLLERLGEDTIASP